MGDVKTINEGDAGDTFIVSFAESDGTPSTPGTIHYRIECDTTKTEVRDDTSVSVDTSVTITLEAADTVIQDDDNAFETKKLIIIINKNLATQKTVIFYFRVRNLTQA